MRRLAVPALLLLAGCAVGEPFDYTPVSELEPGPGLFSGPGGVFVIHRAPGGAEAEAQTLPPPPRPPAGYAPPPQRQSR